MIKNRLIFSAASAAAVVLAGAQAHAQSMDYGALQQLFGEPVTTSATGSPQRASDVPVGMEIITADDIRRSGAHDLTDVLRHVSGFDVMQWTNDSADVGIRGYNEAYSHRVLVLIDGRQVYADHYGYTPWATLPVELNAIRQIEVVKGPSSALFGFNAVDGVINIVTYNPLYDDVNVAAVTGGTQDLVEGSVVATVRAGRLALRITGGGRANKDFSTPIPEPVAGAPRRANDRGLLDLNGFIQLTDKIQLSVSGNYSAADINEMDSAYNLITAQYRTGSVRGQVIADTGVGLLQATAYSNWFQVTDQGIQLLGPTQFKNQLTVAEVQDAFKIGSAHTIRLSAEYRHTEMATAPFAGAHVSYGVFAVGGMWDWNISRTLSLTNALRMDQLMLGRSGLLPPGYPFTNADWNRAFSEFSFNSGLVWKPGDADTFRLTAARGVSVPNLIFSGGVVAVTPVGTVSGAPTLRPTLVTNYEVGWDHAIPALAIQTRVSIFSQNSRDIVSLAGGMIETPAGPFYTQSNIGTSQSKGVELGAKGSFHGDWHWDVNTRYEAIVDTFVPAADDGIAFTDFEHAAPLYAVNASLGWAHGPWEVDGFLHFQSRTYGLQPTVAGTTLVRIPDYAAIDGRVGYKITDRVTLAVSGQNLAKAAQQQTSGPAIQRRVLGTATFTF